MYFHIMYLHYVSYIVYDDARIFIFQFLFSQEIENRKSRNIQNTSNKLLN